MPLMHGKSNKAFEHNIKAEMHAGKPQKQSLAIAYAVKRKGKKMAEGGPVLTHKGYESSSSANHQTRDGEVDEDQSGFLEHEDNVQRPNSAAHHEDDRDLNQHGAHEEGPYGSEDHYAMGGYAEGGEFEGSDLTDSGYQSDDDELDMVGRILKKRDQADYHGNYAEGGPVLTHSGYQTSEHDEDMVGRIMKQRERCYSKGGRVANDEHEFQNEFHEPNEFDDLRRRDDLEEHYTGANSGDELSDEGEDERRHDIVARAMRSFAKKAGRYPVAIKNGL